MKDVLVTGAFGGMGRAATKAFAKAGYRVFALDRRVSPTDDPYVIPVEADVTDEKSISAAYDAVRERTEGLYAVVHFAGIYVLDSLAEISEEEILRAFNVNLLGAYRVNKAFLPLLGRGSRIIMTSSELAPLDPLPFTGLYAITKSAVEKYAFSLRMELQLLDIKVAVLRPGAVNTGMLGDSTAALERFCEKTELYSCNAKRFRAIVERVEARSVAPEKLAKKAEKILSARHMRYVYSINRNPLLLALHVLPKRAQTWVIGKVLS